MKITAAAAVTKPHERIGSSYVLAWQIDALGTVILSVLAKNLNRSYFERFRFFASLRTTRAPSIMRTYAASLSLRFSASLALRRRALISRTPEPTPIGVADVACASATRVAFSRS